MSNISNRHNLVKFVSGESKAFTGQRLAKIGYKGEGKFSDSMCVSLPQITGEVEKKLKESPAMFLSLLVEAVHKAQDGIMKSLWESSGATLTSVSDEDVSLSASLAYLESTQGIGRLTKEFLKAWFTENLAENLSVIFAEKLSLELDHPKIAQLLAGYCGLVESLAAPKIALTVKQMENLISVMPFASDELIANRLVNRMKDAMKEIHTEVELIMMN